MRRTAPAAERSREELIERYVVYDAAEKLLEQLADLVGGPIGEKFARIADDTRIALPEWSELWPGDDDEPLTADGAEALAASRRGTLLAARMLTELAADPQWCARTAADLLQTLDKTVTARPERPVDGEAAKQ